MKDKLNLMTLQRLGRSKIDQKIFIKYGSSLFDIINLDWQICMNAEEDKDERT